MSLRDLIIKTLLTHERIMELYQITRAVYGLEYVNKEKQDVVDHELRLLQDEGLVMRCTPPRGGASYVPTLRLSMRQADCDV